MLRIDLHLHSTVSDGTDTPEELLGKVREAGLELFALTDHDAVKGYGMVCGALREGDPRPLSGVEFSCRDGEGRYHILGYGFDPESSSMRQVVARGHQLRMDKVMARLLRLKAEFGFSFPEEAKVKGMNIFLKKAAAAWSREHPPLPPGSQVPASAAHRCYLCIAIISIIYLGGWDCFCLQISLFPVETFPGN